jgi:hypothetical protein
MKDVLMLVKQIALLAGLLALVACNQKTEQTAIESASPTCEAISSTNWAASAKTKLTISASYEGADCLSAEAALTVTDAAGKQLYTFSLPVEVARNTVFAEADSADKMRLALADWIDPAGNTTMQTTSALPEWKPGVEQPGNDEFPFMPEVSREEYAKLRGENRPLYCHVQGGESMACLAFDEPADAMVKVGLQRFPG